MSKGFKLPGLPVFTDFAGFENPAIHGEIDSFGRALEGPDRRADVEDGIGNAKAGGRHGSGEDDDFSGNPPQLVCGGGHGVGPVGDENLAVQGVFAGFANFKSVCVREFEAVFAEERDQFVFELCAHIRENMGQGRVADFEFGGGIKVDLIDGPTGRDDQHRGVSSFGPTSDRLAAQLDRSMGDTLGGVFQSRSSNLQN